MAVGTERSLIPQKGRPWRAVASADATTRGPETSPKSTTVASDLVWQATRRLRIQALLYGFAFLVSAVLPALIFADERAAFFGSILRWGPTLASLLMALAVVVLTRRPNISAHVVMTIGLVFEVVGSFGIATAQYLDASDWDVLPPLGLSWVAIWVLGFSAIIPNPPRRTLVAAIVSVASVPLTIGFVMGTGRSPVTVGPLPFFFAFILPYIIVVVIAYVSARVLHGLNTALTRARELGSYRLIEPLGEGGMGTVWRAEHQLLARPAAVKVMRPELLDSIGLERRAEFYTRFEREAQATALLRSPHTVSLYDFGVAQDGSLYYVMELLDGCDLGVLVERFGPLHAERVVYLLRQLCHSLAEAHEQGLVHRDIKPANVYVCRNGRDVDVVKVLDFGLVKGSPAPEALAVSRMGAVGGTPAFMAPEQALGRPTIDRRADLYATGCLAYWLLTGQQVFSGDSSVDVMMQHVQATPVPPSLRTELSIPSELETIVLACLAKDPDGRPATADALRDLLAAVPLATPWTEARGQGWWRTNMPRSRDTRG